jgi:A/G-specific adenine glycosylase
MGVRNVSCRGTSRPGSRFSKISDRVGQVAQLSANRIRTVRRRLLEWYQQHRRELPWRIEHDPYKVWVSEIMLQQTQVETVVPYYQRFTSRFPTIESLAVASLDEVLRLWEGLGYYRRAINLWEAARVLVEQFGGKLPADPKLLEKLPGIGRYTAGAIASIGFGVPVAILEANSRRVLRRVFPVGGEQGKPPGDAYLWQLAQRLVPRSDPGTYNQALMELGSLVCTPRSPACPKCPLKRICHTGKSGNAGTLSAPRSPSAPLHARVVALAILWGKRVLLWRYGPKERWAMLWDFPRFEVGRGDDPSVLATEKVADWFACHVKDWEEFGRLRHSVTRFRIEVQCLMAEIRTKRPVLRKNKVCPSSNSSVESGAVAVRNSPQTGGERVLQWVATEELVTLPLTAPARRMAGMLSQFLNIRSKSS